MTRNPQDAARIRTVGTTLRTALGILADMAEQAGPGTRLLILEQLWTRGQTPENGALQAVADLLTAVVSGMGPAEAASAAYLEEARVHIEDAVGGDHIERAQLLLAGSAVPESLLPRAVGQKPSADGDGADVLVTGSADDEDQEEEYTENPATIRYTADVACVRGGKVPALLLIERGWDPHKGLLALPGGHVDEGETSRKAAVRELEEEAGVRVREEDLVLVDVFDAVDRDPRGRYVTAAYVVEVPEDTEAMAGDDAAAVTWVPLADLPDTLAFDHSEIMAAAVRRLR